MSTKNFLTYLITNGDLTSKNYLSRSPQTLKIIETALKAGISLIQIREKNLPTQLLFELSSQAVGLKNNSTTKILVNDRADVAFAANADGVHLTSTSIPTKTIRENFPPNFIIGVSTHTSEKVLIAKNEGADFAVFSPIFKTPSKEKYGEPQGLEKLAKVVEIVNDFPIVALGGINLENFGEIFRAGAIGIAAIRLFQDIENLPKIVNKIQEFTKNNE